MRWIVVIARILGFMTVPFIVGAILSGIVCLAYWFGGYSFEERGLTALTCFLFSLVAFVFGVLAVTDKQTKEK